MSYVLKIGGRTLSAIIIAAAMVSLCAPALAVEDGLGTNVMKNIRIEPAGTGGIELNGEHIVDWADISGGEVIDLKAATNALNTRVGTLETSTNTLNTSVTALKTSTNALNTRVGTAEGAIDALEATVDDANTGVNALNTSTNTLNTSVTALKTSTNALNTRVGTAEGAIDALEATVDDASTGVNALNTSTGTLNTAVTALNASTNALNTATGTLNTAVSALNASTNALNTATNTLNSSVNELKSRTNDWNKAVYTPYAQQIPDNATTVSVDNAVARIGGNAVVTFATCAKQIADGTPGQFLTVICTNASDKAIQFVDGKGVTLSEGVSFSMSANDIIQFVYGGTNWVETHRADN